MIHFENLSIRRGPSLLLEDFSCQLHYGHKVAITGANGCGKSSLFAMILGELEADAGRFRVPADWVTAHVAQETPQTSQACQQYVLDGDEELAQISAAIATAEDLDDSDSLATLYERYENIGGYDAASRAGKLMHGLGFTSQDATRPVSDLSGGWRVRLNLARALMCRSDLLLLDEPNNHLDLDAVIWLESWLIAYPGTLLLISHDRDFLDKVAQQIVHIEARQAVLYQGNYSAFERVRAENLARQQAMHVRQQREIKHMQAFVERFRYKASKARQAQSRLKALERMEVIAPAHVDTPFSFELLEPDKVPEPILRLNDAATGYGDREVVGNVNMALGPGDRVALLGANGAGKSTLIKMLAGELELFSGEQLLARDANIGYFAQHQVEQLRPAESPLDHLKLLDPKAGEQKLRTYLGGFGFSNDDALRPCGPFSGGERSRLALALLVYGRPNLLLLDEPTNHLDLEMRQALALALQNFAGAMVIVSHDRHLLRLTVDQLLLVDAGQVSPFEESLDDYPAWLMQRDRQSTAEAGPAGERRAVSAKQRRSEKARRRKRLQPLKRRVEQTEKELDKLQSQVRELELELGEPLLYQPENKARLNQLLKRKGQLDRACQDAEDIWLKNVEDLEEAAQS